jgi:High-affinity nickel-transport protein
MLGKVDDVSLLEQTLPIEPSQFPLVDATPTGTSRGKYLVKLTSASSKLHQNTPLLNRLPPFVLIPILLLILANCGTWAVVGIIIRYHPYHPSPPPNPSTLVVPVTLSYTFGLRHALDADHIAAIDNVPSLALHSSR